MRRHVALMASAGIMVLVGLSAWPAWAQTTSCQLAPVFLMVRDLIGRERVGECSGPMIRNEAGDVNQPTARGIFTLRTADEVAAFSDGQTTWLYGPNGLESRPSGSRLAWEPAAPAGNGAGALSPTATPTPTAVAFTPTPTAAPWQPTPISQPSTSNPQPAASYPRSPDAYPQPSASYPQPTGSYPLPQTSQPPPPLSGPLSPAPNALAPAPAASPTAVTPSDLPITLDGDDSATSEPINLAGGDYGVRWEARLQNGKSACYVGSRLRRFDDQNPGSLLIHTTLGSAKDRSVAGESRLFSVPPGRYVIDVTTTGCAWKLILQAP